MAILIINKDDLRIDEVQAFQTKARAILVDKANRVLVANYGGVILLPGGSVDDEETIMQAIIRELQEEIGVEYIPDELELLTNIKYFQKNYPKRNGTFQNRLVETYYFVGKFKGVSEASKTLTAKEKKDKFQLELIPLETLEQRILENTNANPRNSYFQTEMLLVIQEYKDSIDVK